MTSVRDGVTRVQRGVARGRRGRVRQSTLVSAIATPPTATSATTAAKPNTNCGSRCQELGASSIGARRGDTSRRARLRRSPRVRILPV